MSEIPVNLPPEFSAIHDRTQRFSTLRATIPPQAETSEGRLLRAMLGGIEFTGRAETLISTKERQSLERQINKTRGTIFQANRRWEEYDDFQTWLAEGQRKPEDYDSMYWDAAPSFDFLAADQHKVPSDQIYKGYRLWFIWKEAGYTLDFTYTFTDQYDLHVSFPDGIEYRSPPLPLRDMTGEELTVVGYCLKQYLGQKQKT